jgi:hypothetical protein
MLFEKVDIEKIIVVKKRDSFLSHFITILKHDYKLSGEIGKSEVKLWQFNLWNAIFFPVFIFRFNSKGEPISINSKTNSFGKLIYILFLIFLSSFFINLVFNITKSLGLFFLMIIYLVFITLFILISLKIHNYEKKKQLKKIYKRLNKIAK